jgi:hypothetical protein
MGKHQQLVGASHLLGQSIGLHPALDAICRHLVAPNEVTLDQDAPDRRVVVAVVGVIAEANQSAILEPHPHRSLDFERHCLERIPEPANFQALPVDCAVLDREAIVIRHYLLVDVEPVHGSTVRDTHGCGLYH